MVKHFLYKIFISIALLGTLTALSAQTLLTATLSTPGNAGVMAENCGGPYVLVFERGIINHDTTEIFISSSGDAQIGVDFNFPAGSFPLVLLPSDTIAMVAVNVVNDGFAEGFESLILEIAYLAGTESDFILLGTGITDDYMVEIISATDTIPWCRYAPLSLSAVSNALIHWSPGLEFDDSTGTDVTVRPFLSGWYYASVGNDTCGAVDSIYLDIDFAEIAGPDTVYICLDGAGAILQGRLEGMANSFVWIPSDTTLSNPLILTPVATPELTTTYILQADFGICISSDTVVVRVDSLPEDQHISIAPLKAYYCAGEIVALFSPSYDSLDFPDIRFLWLPDNGTFLTPTSILNAALELQDTTLYIRENTNNACFTRDSIFINVIPSSVPLSVTDTMLCPGEMFQVVVLSNQVHDPEWTPADGLSCSKCLDPVVTVLGSPGASLFYNFSGMILDCPVGASLSIQIPGVQTINISGDNVVCAGDMVPLTITNPAGLSDFNWVIDSGNASLSCTGCADPTVTITGDQQVKVLVSANTTNPNFCVAQGFFQMNPGQILSVTAPGIAACLGGTTIASTGNPDFTAVQWDVVNGNLSLSCSNCEHPTVTVNSPGLLRFFAESSDPDICRVSGSVLVSIHGDDVSNFILTPDPNQVDIGQGSSVAVFLAINPTPPSSIMWTINGASISATGTMITFNAAKEINFIQATFINSKGCEQTDTISFHTVPPSYMIPNAFTPDNGDDINDNFKIIINGNIVIEKFLIFNRWGQKVYEVKGDDLTGWDGRWKNEPAPSDTYVYTATLRYPDGRIEVAKGDLILLR